MFRKTIKDEDIQCKCGKHWGLKKLKANKICKRCKTLVKVKTFF